MDEERENGNDRRVLGDEWEGWNGKSVDVDTPKWVFVLFSVLSLLIIEALLVLIWWVAMPRFAELGPLASRYIDLTFIVVIAGMTLVIFVYLAGGLFGVVVFTALIRKSNLANALLPYAFNIARLLGISRDRMSNAFVKFNNLLYSSSNKKIRPEKILVLLPRCLKKEIFAGLRELKERHGFAMFTAGGGESARNAIKKYMPDFIIAIACERDLVSGIRDSTPRFAVLGFANRRPEGPCRNTLVDLQEVEKTIKNLI